MCAAYSPEATRSDRPREPRARRRVPAVARLLGGIFNLVFFGFLLTVHAIILVGHRPFEARSLPPRVPLVIVLDAGPRLELGVRLIEEGRSDWIHFSAGEGRGIARRHAERARARLPDATITTEERSLTTLQNAYFSVEELGAIPPDSVLVTDASHLFRAWLCFRWVGARDLHLAPATRLDLTGLSQSRILEEAAATWLTIGRMAVFSALDIAGRDPDPALLAARPGR